MQNTIADEQSRKFNDNIEWMISDEIFNKLCLQWGTPNIDLFASRINYRVPIYVSWKPDPGSIAIDAFSLSWNKYNLYYCFPTVSLIR